jgi:hypothetical protein
VFARVNLTGNTWIVKKSNANHAVQPVESVKVQAITIVYHVYLLYFLWITDASTFVLKAGSSQMEIAQSVQKPVRRAQVKLLNVLLVSLITNLLE